VNSNGSLQSGIKERIMSTEMTLSDATDVVSIPTNSVGTPKHTYRDKADSGIVECAVFDDSMLNIIIDTTKHVAFANKRGNETTLVKTGTIKVGTCGKLSLIYKEESAEARASQLAKDVRAKVRKAVKGTATREDLQFLMRNGFSTEHGAIDAGRIESVHADFLAAESHKRALSKAAANNGSFAAKLQATLKG
jgi:hypothetical protein